jgi:hypothetical protein
VDLDSDVSPQSFNRLEFGVATVTTIIYIQREIMLLEYLSSWNTSEIERSPVGLKRMGHLWSRYPISDK